MPYSGTEGQEKGTTPVTTAAYDSLGRLSQITDAGNGTVSYTYTKDDVLLTVGPAPNAPSDDLKRRQFEYDGLGRLKSVCEVTSGSGSGACGQTVAQTGYLTQYTYSTLGQLTDVNQSGQTRSYSYDRLGRMTQEANPESGTVNYVYDSVTGCNGENITSNGDLVKRTDAANNVACYSYDALHRVTKITYSAANTPTKTFVYDSATVNGQAMANAAGRLARAYTGPENNKVTDLGFSYTVRGEVADVYQATANSSGYRRVTATYWPHGLLNQLSNLSGLPTITYGVDSQGRARTVNAESGQNPVTETAYNVTSLPTAVTFGSQDSDGFSYDSNTGRLTQYQFNINSQSVTGALTWNANGSLHELAITDPFNSANQQTCTYAHDDLSRLSSVNCGSIWAQTFGYDPKGNITKDGTISFLPTYSSSTNRITNLSATYDANGNLTGISADGTYSYAWDAEGRPVTVTRSGTTVNLTYDALGRMIEQNRSGVYTQVIYGPDGGKLALMNGTTLQKAFVPLTGGATAVYNNSGLAYYRHADWLGSSRLASAPNRSLYYDGAYAPFGESYAETGATDRSFTGQNQGTVSGLNDFLFREYHPVAGRWISPDPAGLSAVDITNPQSLNRYAYVLNIPTVLIDPLGLRVFEIGNCVFEFLDYYVDGEYQGTEVYFWGCRGGGGDTGGGGSAGGEPTTSGGGAGGGSASGRGNIPPALKPAAPPPGPKLCVGQAHVLTGNPATVGHRSGLDIRPADRPPLFRVQPNSAAGIPRQWGGPSKLRDAFNGIQGAVGPATNMQTFSGVTDTVGSRDVPNVQQFLMNKYPNKLIVELVNGTDVGNVPVVVMVPAENVCPANTNQVVTAWP